MSRSPFFSPRDFLTLIKVRITLFITLTAVAGYGLRIAVLSGLALAIG